MSSKGRSEGERLLLVVAVILGDAGAHYNLSFVYEEGKGVEKNKEKEAYHHITWQRRQLAVITMLDTIL